MTESILNWVKSGEIAIPEIQRPFVWDSTKVRDLMDSLYNGFPVGYLIAWQNPKVRLKDGTAAHGKKILIDGQQRVTALTAAILGHQVMNQDYKKIRIKIGFNPLEDKFEVSNMAIINNAAWMPDIADVFSDSTNILKLLKDYCTKNPDAKEDFIYDKIDRLKKIKNKQIGMIELDSDLDIETVTEIFIRINSKGVVLSQADFVMSKIASNELYGGAKLRKFIDYFCHMTVAPDFYATISEGDNEFAKTEHFKKISWLKNETDDLYDPDYNDLIRVAFTSEFGRGKLSDLVSLLSGRNFETKTYEEPIAQASFARLEKSVLNFANETNFKRFVMIIKSAGFISGDLIRSQNALNFAYIVYLTLKTQNCNSAEIEHYVRRWFVMAVLTGRYSGSPESMFDLDIRNITSRSVKEYLNALETAELSEAYWDTALAQNLDSPVASSPYFNVFLAAQVKHKDKGFLSKDITVEDLINYKGDVHHIFPKDYLKSNGLKKNRYNQIANYVYMQSEINVKIGNKAPKAYFQELKKQCEGGKLKYGGICDWDELIDNLKVNCIPESIVSMELENYDDFLVERRNLIAHKVRKYYKSL
jgi:hypothetical protein